MPSSVQLQADIFLSWKLLLLEYSHCEGVLSWHHWDDVAPIHCGWVGREWMLLLCDLPYPLCLDPGYRAYLSTPLCWFWDYGLGVLTLSLYTSSFSSSTGCQTTTAQDQSGLQRCCHPGPSQELGMDAGVLGLHMDWIGASSGMFWLYSCCQQIISEDLWVKSLQYYPWKEGPAMRGTYKNTCFEGNRRGALKSQLCRVWDMLLSQIGKLGSCRMAAEPGFRSWSWMVTGWVGDLGDFMCPNLTQSSCSYSMRVLGDTAAGRMI